MLQNSLGAIPFAYSNPSVLECLRVFFLHMSIVVFLFVVFLFSSIKLFMDRLCGPCYYRM